MELPLDIGAGDSAGPVALSLPSVAMADDVAELVAGSNAAAGDGESASTKRRRDEEQQALVETPTLPSLGPVTEPVDVNTAADLSVEASGPSLSPSEPSLPVAKKPRRRSSPLPPTTQPGDLPRADEILDALERQSVLLEQQALAQEQQQRVLQQLLAFLSRSAT